MGGEIKKSRHVAGEEEGMEIKKTIMGTGMGLGWVPILGIPCLPHPAGATKKVIIRRHHWEVAKKLGFTHTGRWGDKEVPVGKSGRIWVVPPPKTFRVTVVDHGSPEIDGSMEVFHAPRPPEAMEEEVENFLQKHPVVGDRVKILEGASQWLLENPGHCTYWGGGKVVPELRGEDNATVSQSGVENGLVRISLPNRYLRTFKDLGAYIELPKKFVRLIF